MFIRFTIYHIPSLEDCTYLVFSKALGAPNPSLIQISDKTFKNGLFTMQESVPTL